MTGFRIAAGRLRAIVFGGVCCLSLAHGAAPAQTCAPHEQRAPEARSQRPAMPGQTRACGVTSPVRFDVSVVAGGFEEAWAVEPLPAGGFLVSEQGGRLRIVHADGSLASPLGGLPAVDAGGQGGLLDVALSPAFASDHRVYWSYVEPRAGGNGTSVARGVLDPARNAVSDVSVVFRAEPAHDGHKHFGSRLAFGPDGLLYITLGERGDRALRAQAQRLDSHLGKVVRIAPDGAAPPDNPFVRTPGARPEIWTLGHRNVQAAAFDPAGRLWIVEHGTSGGDELNLLEAGANYGWPRVAYGEEYIGLPIPGAETAREGYRQPVYYWDPVIAPSGAQFYTGDAFPGWRGNLFVGSLKDRVLVRLVLDGGRVAGEEHLLGARGQRVRDVRQGADGTLYVLTGGEDGELLALTPAREGRASGRPARGPAPDIRATARHATPITGHP